MGMWGNIGIGVSSAISAVKPTPWWQTALKGVGEGLSAYAETTKGDGGQTPAYPTYTPASVPQGAKDNTSLFVTIGVGAAVAIISLMVLLK